MMSNRPAFDHCYRSIADDEVYQDFASRGFLLNPQMAKHPGGKVCQFLHFQSPSGEPVYLEFVYNVAQPNDENQPCAGFALKPEGDWDKELEGFMKRCARWAPKSEHRNYDWMRDSTSRLPGWNFLTFAQPPLDDIYTWLIQYESPRAARALSLEQLNQHPNGVRTVLGFLWDGSNPGQLRNMAQISRSLVKNDELELSGGTVIQRVLPDHPLAASFAGKLSSFWAVVLGADDLDAFIERAHPDDILEIDGQRAARIRLDDRSWDILVLETKAWSTPVASDAESVLDKQYIAYQERDLETFLAFYDEKAKVLFEADNKVIQGVDDIRVTYGSLFEQAQTIDVEVHRKAQEQGYILDREHAIITYKDHVLEWTGYSMYRVNAGRIASLHLFPFH